MVDGSPNAGPLGPAFFLPDTLRGTVGRDATDFET